MKMDELLRKIHDYTNVEKYLREHREIRTTYKLMKEFNESLSGEDAIETLAPLLFHSQNSSSQMETLPEDFFFKDEDQLKVHITQHTRYSTSLTHKHDFYEVFYVYEGEFTQVIDNQTYTMRSGDICLIPPGFYHSLDVDNYSIILNILIQKDTFSQIFFDNIIGKQNFSTYFKSEHYSKSIDTYVIFQTKGDLKIQTIILETYLEIINRRPYYSHIIHSNLLLLFSYLLREYGDNAIMPDLNKKKNIQDFEILTYINDNYSDITLDDLAEEFHYSKQYVSTRVREITGLSFSYYLMQKRMNVAAELLKHTSMKVKDISTDVGYKNQETFNRAFNRYYNMTPSQLRKDYNTYK